LEGLVHLVRAVDDDVQRIDVVQFDQRQTKFSGQVMRGDAGWNADDVEPFFVVPSGQFNDGVMHR